jgi:hypothetical protein
MNPSKPLRFCVYLQRDQVKNGVFGAMMNVELVNDGPVTIILVLSPRAASESSVWLVLLTQFYTFFYFFSS